MLVSSSDPALSNITYEQLRDIYAEQARALVEGGVGSAAARNDAGFARAQSRDRGHSARVRARDAARSDSSAADAHYRRAHAPRHRYPRDRAALDALAIDVIGLNCSTGPAQMRDSIRYLCENSRCFVSVIPNAGLPLMGPQGETIYPEGPEELGARARRVRARFRRQRRRRLLRHDARAHHRAARCRRLR